MIVCMVSDIGQRIRRAREKAVMSQQELADKAKITRHSLSVIETGRTRPRPSTIRKIAEALNIPPSDLVE